MNNPVQFCTRCSNARWVRTRTALGATFRAPAAAVRLVSAARCAIGSMMVPFPNCRRDSLSTSKLKTGTSRRPDWDRAFFDPIDLPDGRWLATLKDAAEYITGLPASEHDLAHWRAAIAALILSAEHGESGADPMLARIGMIQALADGQPKSAPTPRKKAAKKYKIVR
jgi:hypothetical protein